MSEEKRRSDRKDLVVPTVIMLVAGSIEGDTVNASRNGLLIRGTGSISVVVKVDGKEYRGRLVRSEPMVDGGTYYAIDLDDPFQG